MPDDLSGLKDEFEVEMVAQAAEQADEKLDFLIQALAVELTAPTDDDGRRERSIRASIDNAGLKLGILLERRDELLRKLNPPVPLPRATVRQSWWARTLSKLGLRK